MHDTASIEAKKMIVNCLIKRVDVYRDYKLHIDCYEMLPLDGGHFIIADQHIVNSPEMPKANPCIFRRERV